MQHVDSARPGGLSWSVLIVDDHPLYSDALASALGGVFAECRVKKAGSLGTALSALEAGFEPDLIMFDLRLPDVCGISGFIGLRARMPHIPILVISSLSLPALVFALMREGAAGFLPKDASAEDLNAALAEIALGRKFLPREYRNLGAADHSEEAGPAEGIQPRLAALTPQQQKVMRLICEGKANKQIAYDLSLAEATVKAHITALLRRLGASNRTQAALMMEAAAVEAMAGATEPEALSFLSR